MSGIIRVQHSDNYTCIANLAIRDTRLSLKARGLHHLLLSYPNNWEVNIEHLASKASEHDGRTAIMTALRELETIGYLTRQQTRNEKGHITGYESVVRELPQSGFPTTVKTKKKGSRNSDKPQSENPPMDNPTSENQTQISNVFQQLPSEEVSISPLSPQGELEEREFGFQIPEEPEVSTPSLALSDKLRRVEDKNEVSGLDKYSAPPLLPVSNRVQNIYAWIPEGPWKVDGKLDYAFLRWQAQKWVDKFGGRLEDKEADVLRNWKKDADNISISWRHYSAEYSSRLENVALRMEAGIPISEEEQARFVENQKAITHQLPDELNPVLSTPSLPPQATLEPVQVESSPTASLPPSKRDIPLDESGFSESVQAYQVYTPQKIEASAPPPEVVEEMRQLQQKVSMPKGSKVRNKISELDELNQWLQDPILRSEAIARIKRKGYAVECDEYGVPISAHEPEF